ncbi:MAG TPA: gliding motility-associated C-terminal domain-containing protein [Sphingobacteriaceae bacterium]
MKHLKLLLVCLLLLLLNAQRGFSAVEKIPAGSFIIDMGAADQTVANGLKPYGLIYELLSKLRVPVKWVINPNKIKDGADFTYNGKTYRGGPFIILAQYRTTEVNNAIIQWKALGVRGEDTNSEQNADVYATLSYAPRWTIDKTTGWANIVAEFFKNAGIPPSAHGGADQSMWKNPAELTECDDIFVFPHADPTWNDHKNLQVWNKDHKGAIWAACHTPSVLEQVKSPDGKIQLNFLTTTGLVDYQSHQREGNPPYSYFLLSDPVMQFIGKLDFAAMGGTENYYLPLKTGKWRNNVKVLVTNTNNNEVPAISNGPAAVSAYGRAFDDPKNGWVMYQGGHFHNGSTNIPGPDHIALQRAFFNFSLMSVVDRQNNGVKPQITASSVMSGGSPYPVKFSVPPGIDLSRYSIRWTASSGRIEPDESSEEIIYTPSADQRIKIALITLVLTDACGRQYFTTHNVNLKQCESQSFVPEIIAEAKMYSNMSYQLKAKVPADVDLSKYTIKWKASTGTLVNDDAAEVTYRPSTDTDVHSAGITLTLTDKCGIEFTANVTPEISHCPPSVDLNLLVDASMEPGETISAKFTVAPSIDPDNYKISWEVTPVGPASSTEREIYVTAPLTKKVQTITVKLTLTDLCGKEFTATTTITVNHVIHNNGKISVPRLVSPNDDGKGLDYLHIENIELYPNNEMIIYNRWGNIVYQTTVYDNYSYFFDGKREAQKVTDGIFYYLLTVHPEVTGNPNTNTVNTPPQVLKGYFILKR